MKLGKRTKRILLIIAGVFVLLAGLVLSFPGIPGPGFLLIFWGLALMGAEGIVFAVVAWFFSLIGLSWLGVKIIKWLRKASFKTKERSVRKETEPQNNHPAI